MPTIIVMEFSTAIAGRGVYPVGNNGDSLDFSTGTVRSIDLNDSDSYFGDIQQDSTASDQTLVSDFTYSAGTISAGSWVSSAGQTTLTSADGTSTIKVGYIRLESGVDAKELLIIEVISGTFDPTAVYNSLGANDANGGFAYAVACFSRDTRILTKRGELTVEELNAGDLIVTQDNGVQPVRWVGSQVVCATGELAPVVIKAGVLGNARALRVSPCHRMLITGQKAQLLFGESQVLVAAKHLTGWDGIYVERTKNVEYFHIMFESHQIIMAEGAMTESFFPGDVCMNSMAAEAKEEIFTIFPELRISLIGYGGLARRSLKAYEAQLLAA